MDGCDDSLPLTPSGFNAKSVRRKTWTAKKESGCMLYPYHWIITPERCKCMDGLYRFGNKISDLLTGAIDCRPRGMASALATGQFMKVTY